MSRPRAPTAMRRPISRVRSVTDTSMMFMMPMPPTSSDTEAMAASSKVMHLRRLLLRLGDLGEVAQREVVVLAGLQAVPLAQQAADLAPRRPSCPRASRTLTEIEPTARALAWLLPSTFRLAVVSGISTDVVLVLARRALALALEHADDAERNVLDPDDLAERIAVAEEVAARRSGRAAPPWRRRRRPPG